MSHDPRTNTNPLHRFHSYNYHHILIACDSTQTAQELERKGTTTEFQRSRENQRAGGDAKYRAQSVQPGGDGKNFVVLIDGLVDSEFFIQNVDWATVIAPTTTESATLMGVQGNIEIFEPYGAQFIRRLVNAGIELGTDASGLVFMLKTVFVGYRDERAPRYHVETIPNVRPFLFTITNLTSVIDETGSSYDMSIVGAQNGFAKLQHVSNIGKGFTLSVDKKQTVGQTLNNAFTKINDLYIAQAEKLGVEVKDKGFSESSDFRRVSYEVDVGVYDDEKYLAGTVENTLTEDKIGTMILTFGENATVEKVVDTIMKSSLGVQQDKEKDVNYIYKINSFLKSTPDTMTILYQVNRYLQPTATFNNITTLEASEVPEELIRTYDYIFTGKNIDILELDIKMNMGFAFFQTAQTTTSHYDQTSIREEKKNESVSNGDPNAVQTSGNKPTPKRPLFLGAKITDPKIRNTKYPVTTAKFYDLLESHAFLENTALTVKIAGDPTLMNQTLVTVEEPRTVENIGEAKKRTFLSSPIIFKINIQYPVGDRLEPFWYQGFYTLQQVDTSFAEGTFTQTLRLYALPSKPNITEETTTEEDDDGNINDRLGDGGKKSSDTETSNEKQTVSAAG